MALDLPLPRFVGLKSEPEMRYATLPASIEGPGAQCGAAPAAVSWTPADRSTSRHPEANVEKKVSMGPKSPEDPGRRVSRSKTRATLSSDTSALQ